MELSAIKRQLKQLESSGKRKAAWEFLQARYREQPEDAGLAILCLHQLIEWLLAMEGPSP